MSAHAGNLFPSGLFVNGCFPRGGNDEFTSFSTYTDDSYSGSSCIAQDRTNRYGATVNGDVFIEVDPQNEYYQMSLMVKTYSRSYNNRLGSGHLGFSPYDKDYNFIGHAQAFSHLNTTLSRDLNVGDTTMYVVDATGWGPTSVHNRQVNFYAAGTEYTTVGAYSRYNIRLNYPVNMTQLTGEWSVPLPSGSPYTFPTGTPVGRSWDGGTHHYALGAPVYPEEWTQYKTGVMHGWVKGTAASGADFRWGTKYIRFLNLCNYNYRTEQSGASARYLLDNICFVKLNGNHALPDESFKRKNIFRRILPNPDDDPNATWIRVGSFHMASWSDYTGTYFTKIGSWNDEDVWRFQQQKDDETIVHNGVTYDNNTTADTIDSQMIIDNPYSNAARAGWTLGGSTSILVREDGDGEASAVSGDYMAELKVGKQLRFAAVTTSIGGRVTADQTHQVILGDSHFPNSNGDGWFFIDGHHGGIHNNMVVKLDNNFVITRVIHSNDVWSSGFGPP